MMKNLDLNKSSWKKVKFGDVVIEPKETCKDIVSEGIEHVVGLEHIDSGDMHLRKSASIEESTTFTKKFRKGDVLFGRRRAYLKKAAQANFNGICSGDITVFRAQKNLLPELLPFIVNNDKFFDHAIKHSAGGLSPRVKFKDLANYEFLLPPKEEQAKLAELLWAMDDVIEKEKELTFNIEVFIETLTNDLLTGKKRLNKVSKNWNYKSLGEISSVKRGLASQYLEYVQSEKDGVRLIRINDIQSDSPKYIKKTEMTKQLTLQKDDILMSGTGTVGLTYLVEDEWEGCSFSYNVPRIRMNLGYSPFYIQKALNCKFVNKQKASMLTGNVQRFLDIKAIKKLVIPLPNLEEQLAISSTINNVMSSEILIKSKLTNSQSLQKSLINQIF